MRVAEQSKARHLARNAIKAFADCVANSDIAAIGEAGELVDVLCQWPAAFRAVLRVRSPNQRFRKHFLESWLRHGDHLRQEVSDDLLLADGLRRLLPAYSAGPVILWRGDSFYNRRRRTYGLSWTSSEEVGRSFMNGIWRTLEDGSVLLKTEAPADAVICSPLMLGDHYGEAEYLVDRRRLAKVEIIDRASELSLEEYAAAKSAQFLPKISAASAELGSVQPLAAVAPPSLEATTAGGSRTR